VAAEEGCQFVSSEGPRLVKVFPSSAIQSAARALTVAMVAATLILHPTAQAEANGLGQTTFVDGSCNIEDSTPTNHLTPETAFVIDTVDKLWEVGDCDLPSQTVYFKITSNLDASLANFAPTQSPIGYSSSALIDSFSGVIDGQGFEVSVSMTTNHGAALFAYIDSATISDLVITGAFSTTTVTNSADHGAGGLAVKTNGVVNLISISNQSVVSGFRYVGGLVGYAVGPIDISLGANEGTLSGRGEHVGGLFGWGNSTATIADSSNTGELTSNGNVGGLAGWIQGAVAVEDSMNSGQINASQFYVGGIVGRTGSTAHFQNTTNSGQIAASGFSYVGGISGYVSGTLTISNSVNSGDITAKDNSGGLVGYSSGVSNFSGVTNTGNVTGQQSLGGIAGYIGQNVVFSAVVNHADIDGTQAIGGIIGTTPNNKRLTFAQIRTSGNVTGTGDTGGIVGVAGGVVNLDQVLVESAVGGGSNAGGAVGYANKSVFVSNSAVVGSVTGGSRQGPWIGALCCQAVVAIDNSYTTTPGSEANGVYGVRYFNNVAVFSGGITAASSFTSSDITSASSSASTSEFYNGWDFDSIWGFGTCEENSGLPMLRVFDQVGTFYSQGCYTSPPPQAPAADEPAPVYSGPRVSAITSVVAGSQVTLSGSRLETITKVYAGSLEIEIVDSRALALILLVPMEAEAGTYDLILVSGFGTLTFQSGITILAGEVPDVPPTLSEMAIRLISKSLRMPNFTRQQTVLTTSQTKWLEGHLSGSGLTKIVCTGVTSESMTMSQRIESRKRAKLACERSAEILGVMASVWYQTKSTVHEDYVGKVLLTIKG
jgi:hypothetical protein